MKEYPKIQSLFKRDKSKKIVIGDYSIKEFKYLENNLWEFTEKINGMNICIKWDGINIRFGNLDSHIPTKLINFCMDIIFNQSETFQSIFGNDNVELYFEGYGKGIQEPDGSRYLSDSNSLILFDINIDGWWLQYDNCKQITKELGLDIVPLIGKGNLKYLMKIVQNGFKSELGNLIAEGIVAKPLIPLYTKKGDRIITKLKYLDFPSSVRGIVHLG
jgi:hypothetical protein